MGTRRWSPCCDSKCWACVSTLQAGQQASIIGCNRRLFLAPRVFLEVTSVNERPFWAGIGLILATWTSSTESPVCVCPAASASACVCDRLVKRVFGQRRATMDRWGPSNRTWCSCSLDYMFDRYGTDSLMGHLFRIYLIIWKNNNDNENIIYIICTLPELLAYINTRSFNQAYFIWLNIF